MKFTITLHPVSLLVGAAGLGGVLWLASAMQAPASTGAATSRAVSQAALTISNPIEVKGVPVPGNMVTIKQGTPYVVPTGRVFVLTGIGSNSAGVTTVLRVNGQQELSVFTGGNAATPSIMAVPAGWTAPAGATMTVENTGFTGVAIGYLSAY